VIEVKSSELRGRLKVSWVSGTEVFDIENMGTFCRGEPAVLLVYLKSLAPLRLKRYKERKAVLCFKHKHYQALRRPRTNCTECWEAYNERHEVS